MTPAQFAALTTGDIVRHKHASEAMVVTANYGRTVIAVRAVHMTNPDEWLLIERQPPPR